MATRPTVRRPRGIRRRPAALDWPAWTDDYVVALGPDPDDAAWWAENSPSKADAYVVEPSIRNAAK